MDLYLGIDVGTTNLKVAAFSSDGDLVAIRRKATPLSTGSDGLPGYDADLFWDEISTMLKDVKQECHQHNIRAVSTTGMAEAMVALDEYGNCLDLVIPWFDTRSKSYSDHIVRDLGVEKIFSITGLDVNPIFSLPKLMLIQNLKPAIFGRANKWLQLPEYILYRLSGQCFTDFSLASRTMLFDIHSNDWCDSLLEYSFIQLSHLPKIVDGGTPIGLVSPEVAHHTGLPTSCVVVVGGHDHICATIPAGAVNGEHVLDSSGTAESFIYVSKSGSALPKKFSGLRVGRYLTKDKYALWGGIVSSGASVEWGIQRLCNGTEFGDSTFDKLGYDSFFDSNLNQIPVGSHGVIFLPHLRGAGAPYWNPMMRGSFLGLNSTISNADLMKSVFEGLSMQSRMIIETMEKASGSKITALNTVGGGSRLTYWQNIKATVTHRTINIPNVNEATLLGAAMLAAIGVGEYSSIEEASQVCFNIGKTISSRLESEAKYDELYKIYVQANDQTKVISEQLSKFI